VSKIPSVFITGLTASNKIADVPIRRQIITIFIIHEDREPDDSENGLTKKIRTRNNDMPNIVEAYLVFSLYWTI
jgi:hypothetical protein